MVTKIIWNTLMPNDEYKKCRVCGLAYENFFPWGEDGQTASFEICDCCGTQFGYEDCKPETIKTRRSQWIHEGAKWSSRENKPRGWNLDEALNNIPEKFK